MEVVLHRCTKRTNFIYARTYQETFSSHSFTLHSAAPHSPDEHWYWPFEVSTCLTKCIIVKPNVLYCCSVSLSVLWWPLLRCMAFSSMSSSVTYCHLLCIRVCASMPKWGFLCLKYPLNYVIEIGNFRIIFLTYDSTNQKRITLSPYSCFSTFGKLHITRIHSSTAPYEFQRLDLFL